jgi:hypothetical protein
VVVCGGDPWLQSGRELTQFPAFCLWYLVFFGRGNGSISRAEGATRSMFERMWTLNRVSFPFIGALQELLGLLSTKKKPSHYLYF